MIFLGTRKIAIFNKRPLLGADMIHSRPDYNRIQDPSGLIPEQEPVLLIRGQDKYAAQMAEYYAHLLDQNGDAQGAASMREHVARLASWKTKKTPDLPIAESVEIQIQTTINQRLTFHGVAMADLSTCGVRKGDLVMSASVGITAIDNLFRIDTFNVWRPELRGKGFGTKLMQAIIDKAKTTQGINGICVIPTQEAIGFYEKFGFEQDGNAWYLR
jgi:GNAT superfamily N-acetyltransferase